MNAIFPAFAPLYMGTRRSLRRFPGLRRAPRRWNRKPVFPLGGHFSLGAAWVAFRASAILRGANYPRGRGWFPAGPGRSPFELPARPRPPFEPPLWLEKMWRCSCLSPIPQPRVFCGKRIRTNRRPAGVSRSVLILTLRRQWPKAGGFSRKMSLCFAKLWDCLEQCSRLYLT